MFSFFVLVAPAPFGKNRSLAYGTRYVTLKLYYLSFGLTFFQFYKFVKQRCKNSVGLPLGIQIVGRRFQEELILSLMTELEEVSNKF